MTTPDERVELTSLGICLTCHGQDEHAEWCPVPHVGFADGTEICDRCRRGLDDGEAYTAPTTERLGSFTYAHHLLCLQCSLDAAGNTAAS